MKTRKTLSDQVTANRSVPYNDAPVRKFSTGRQTRRLDEPRFADYSPAATKNITRSMP